MAIMVLGALAPSVSRALAFASGGASTYMVVCTPAGLSFPQSAPGSDGAGSAECAACLIAARDMLEPPAAIDLSRLIRSDLSDAFVLPAHAEPPAAVPAPDARPRGPPTLA